MESGIVTSYKNKGIIIPELISLPFFLRSSNICLKNCFADKFSLRAFIFPHAKFLKPCNTIQYNKLYLKSASIVTNNISSSEFVYKQSYVLY